MSGQIFLHCRSGKTLWVPGHTPTPNEKQPIHMLSHILPDELAKSFYLFDEEIQIVDNPQLCTLVPNAKTPQEIHQAINKFRSKCHQDENFLLSRCYNPKHDATVAHVPQPSGGMPSPASVNAQQYLPGGQATGVTNRSNPGLDELLAQYFKQQQQQQLQQGSLLTSTTDPSHNISSGLPLSVDKSFRFSSSSAAMPQGNAVNALAQVSSANISQSSPQPQQNVVNPNDLANMLGTLSGNVPSTTPSNVPGNLSTNLPYASRQQTPGGAYPNMPSMLMYSGGYENNGGTNANNMPMMPPSSSPLQQQQQQQQQDMMMMMMRMMPSSSPSMSGMDNRGRGAPNYSYSQGYPSQNAGASYNNTAGMPLNNNLNNNNNMMIRGGMDNGRYYSGNNGADGNPSLMGNLISGGGIPGASGNPFSQSRYRNAGRMYGGQNMGQMPNHSAALLRKGILDQKVHENPEPIEHLIEGVVVPKAVAETYASPSLTLVCATMPGARMTVWLRIAPEISPDEINESGTLDHSRGSHHRMKKSMSSAKDGKSKYVHCRGGIILMLKASFEEVEKSKPVMLFPKQICTHFLVHGYCSRMSCLHEHHSEGQLRELIAARHVQQKAMKKIERQELIKNIGKIEKENVIRFNEGKEGRQREESTDGPKEQHSTASSGHKSSTSAALDTQPAHSSEAPVPTSVKPPAEHMEKEKSDKLENGKRAELGVIEEEEDDDDDLSSSIFSSSSDSDGDEGEDKGKKQKSKRYKFEDATIEAPIKKKIMVQRALSISNSSASSSCASTDDSPSARDDDDADENDEETKQHTGKIAPASPNSTKPTLNGKEKAKEVKQEEATKTPEKKKDKKIKATEGGEDEEKEASATKKKTTQDIDEKKERNSDSTTSDEDEKESTEDNKAVETKPGLKKRGRPAGSTATAAAGKRAPAKKAKK